MKRRQVLGWAAVAGGGGALLPQAANAAEDDPWRDERRDRVLPLRVRWPDGDAACGLVVHSHGLGGNRLGGDVWGEAWRRAGVAVVHLQHPGSDTEVLRGGLRELRAAANAAQLRARVGDMQFAVDEILRRAERGLPGWSRVRTDAIGASGHSFGAVTVQALAGQRFPVRADGIAELRFRSFIAFSPSPGRARSVAEAFGGVTRPFLAVTGSLDDDPMGGALTAAERAGVYAGLPAGRRALLWLADADHMTFAGNGAPALRARVGPLQRHGRAAELEPLHHARVAALTTLWWRATLLGDAAAAASLREPAGLGDGDRWQQD